MPQTKLAVPAYIKDIVAGVTKWQRVWPPLSPLYLPPLTIVIEKRGSQRTISQNYTCLPSQIALRLLLVVDNYIFHPSGSTALQFSQYFHNFVPKCSTHCTFFSSTSASPLFSNHFLTVFYTTQHCNKLIDYVKLSALSPDLPFIAKNLRVFHFCGRKPESIYIAVR